MSQFIWLYFGLCMQQNGDILRNNLHEISTVNAQFLAYFCYYLKYPLVSFNLINMSNFSTSLSNITDENLFVLCRQYGEKARYFRQKFISLLPEINRRRLYEKKGFSSVFEFAAKLCGLSEEQVCVALSLEKNFEDKPLLKKLLVTGEVSINKLHGKLINFQHF